MIGLDTNVLVRYMTKDDPLQSGKATRLVNDSSAAGESLFVNHIVLCELCWVMESCYDLDRSLLEDVLERILETRDFEVEAKDLALEALRDFKRGGIDFADCLIGRKNKASACEKTLTFDSKLKRLDYFQQL